MKIYFVSENNMNNKVLKPRIPNNFLVKNNYEDSKTKRVCFSKSIDGALTALSRNIDGRAFFVHVPIDDHSIYAPSESEVPDVKITNEVWIKEDVKVKIIGMITVSKSIGRGLPYKYGKDKTATLYKWQWRWSTDEDHENFTESVILNKDNIEFNVDRFTEGKSNILLITGLSGSGKSTLARKISSENHAELIEMDIFEHNKSLSDDQLRQAGNVFYEYFTENSDGKKFRKMCLDGESPSGTELTNWIKKFMNVSISYAKKHPKQKFVIEGVQIYSSMDVSQVSAYPLIIMGTSMKNSILQRFKRNGNGKVEWGVEIRNEFKQLLQWYWGEEKLINSFINNLKIVQNNRKTKSEENNMSEVFNESYFEASENLQKCEKLLEIISSNIKINPTTNINKTKENILLEKLFEKEFGLAKMCIYWDSKTTPASVGAWNYVSSHILFNKRKPHILLNKTSGYYDAEHKDRCCLMLSPGLVSSLDLTPREMLAVILHEIGHNMDYSAYKASSDIIERFSDDITEAKNPNSVNKPLYNLNKGIDMMIRSSKFLMSIRDFFGRVLLKYAHWSSIYLSPMTSLYMGVILPYTPVYHFINYWTKKKEVFADSFALAYGYGPELASALLKLGDRGHLDVDIAKDRFANRPFSKFLFNLGMINDQLFQSIIDPHGTNQFRIKKMIVNLESQIKNSGYDAEVITEMSLCLDRIKEQYDSILTADEGDVDSLSKIYLRIIENVFKGNTDFITRIKKDRQA